MKLFELKRELCLPISLDESWAFFSNPRNLALITPPSLNLNPIGDVPDAMFAGMIVSYKLRPFPGVHSIWITEISHVERPFRFVDEQRFGPYKFWHHTHEFEAINRGVRTTDTCYTPLDLFPLCWREQIPLVYDIHHHRCFPDGFTIREATEMAITTWNREPLFHISSPIFGWKGPTPERHHDFVDPGDFPAEWLGLPITVEIEAKAKEVAVIKLIHEFNGVRKKAVTI